MDIVINVDKTLSSFGRENILKDNKAGRTNAEHLVHI